MNKLKSGCSGKFHKIVQIYWNSNHKLKSSRLRETWIKLQEAALFGFKQPTFDV